MVGVLKSRRLDLSRYRDTLDLEIHLEFENKIHLYAKISRTHPYPLGLLRTAKIRATNVIKKRSGKGNRYLMSTIFTDFIILEYVGGCSDEMLGSFKIKTKLIKILNVQITAVCGGCLLEILPGSERCEYVGCNRPTVSFRLKCSALIEDGASNKVVTTSEEDHLKILLDLPNDDWDELLEVARTEGSLSYPGGSSVILCQYCDSFLNRSLRRFNMELQTCQGSDCDPDLKLVLINVEPV